MYLVTPIKQLKREIEKEGWNIGDGLESEWLPDCKEKRPTRTGILVIVVQTTKERI